MFRLVEYLMKKSFVDDKLLVGGGDFFIEHLRPGRIDETIGASLEDQNRKSDPVRFGADTLHRADHFRAQPCRHLSHKGVTS